MSYFVISNHVAMQLNYNYFACAQMYGFPKYGHKLHTEIMNKSPQNESLFTWKVNNSTVQSLF